MNQRNHTRYEKTQSSEELCKYYVAEFVMSLKDTQRKISILRANFFCQGIATKILLVTDTVFVIPTLLCCCSTKVATDNKYTKECVKLCQTKKDLYSEAIYQQNKKAAY